MKIAISAESAIDLPKELLEKYQIHTLPFTVTLGDKEFYDGDITAPGIIEGVKLYKVLPKTSAINEFQYDEHFAKLTNDYDAIIHFSLSSNLSSACNNAIASSKKFNNVHVIDTRTLSTGIALLALYARKLIDNGLGVEEIIEKCLERIPYIHASVTLKSLEYLHKGGRCSTLLYLGASLLKIRPQVNSVDGVLKPAKKYRGNFDYVVKKYCQEVISEYDNIDYSVGFITYTTASIDIVKSAVDILKNAGFKEVIVTRAGATITSHTGEDCLGLLFLTDGEH